MATVVLKRGMNLWKLAKQYPSPGKSITERIKEIAAANGIANPNKVREGQSIVIPGGLDSPVSTPPVMPPAGAMPAAPPPLEPRMGPPDNVGVDRMAGADVYNAQQKAMLDQLIRGKQDEVSGDLFGPGGVQTMPHSPLGIPAPEQAHPPYGTTPLPTAPDIPDVSSTGANMDTTGLIQPVLPDEQGMGLTQPNIYQNTAMDPAIAGQPAVISENGSVPQGGDIATALMQPTSETFQPTPPGMADPELQAIMADPVRRQQMIQMLMAAGPGM